MYHSVLLCILCVSLHKWMYVDKQRLIVEYRISGDRINSISINFFKNWFIFFVCKYSSVSFLSILCEVIEHLKVKKLAQVFNWLSYYAAWIPNL